MWHADPYSADGHIQYTWRGAGLNTHGSSYICSPWCFAVNVGVTVVQLLDRENKRELCPLHWSLPPYTRAYNVTQTLHREHNGFSVFAHHLCLLARWVNTKTRLVVPAKDASSRILCFLCPLCVSPLWRGRGCWWWWWCHFVLPHMTAVGSHRQGHMLTRTVSGTWLNVFFYWGNYRSLGWLLKRSLKRANSLAAELAPAVRASANYSFIIWAINGRLRKWQTQMETSLYV